MEKEKSYILGIIGGILGGFIGSVLWILLYVYANFAYSFLAILIAYGILKGYQIFDGKIDNKISWIIGIISFICVSITTLIIIPNLLLLKEYGTLSWLNFKTLFITKEFLFALLGDYILALLFTFMGLFITIKIVNFKKLDMPKKRLKEIKQFMIKNNALTKETSIKKEDIKISKSEFKYLFQKGIIKKYKGKYYLNSNLEKEKYHKIIWLSISIGIIFIVSLGINILTNDNNKRSVRPIIYKISNNYQEYKYDEDGDRGWSYFPKNDITGENGLIYVFYYTDENIKDVDSPKLMEEVFQKEDGYINSEIFTNKNGYQVLYIEFELDDYYAFYYYVFNGNRYAFIEGSIPQNVNNLKLKDDIREVAETLKWR